MDGAHVDAASPQQSAIINIIEYLQPSGHYFGRGCRMLVVADS
jgi:hypothetical protein